MGHKPVVEATRLRVDFILDRIAGVSIRSRP